ncbi:pyridoxamine 5'-phosphate oxidase family protein [Angustibacter sp. McL0619]|uniref:pyridoxamine 5'-phosphate oxidase family protein n=1 Tax=Angustibacter sp. McL0619 TaxID=3415676 RepID=UPI003CF1BFA9
MSSRQPAPRTQVRRLPDKQLHDVAERDRALDTALVAHIAVVSDGQPFVLPVGFARDGERLIVHGSNASRLFRSLAGGAPTCLTVTLVDGLVLARSQFESSMHYRSVMVFGSCTELHGEQKSAALATLTERLMPGRGIDARPPSPKELAATCVLAIPLQEWSMKVSAAPPDDDPADLDRPVWAGVVPMEHRFAEPVDAPDLRAPYPVPQYVRSWPAGRH